LTLLAKSWAQKELFEITVQDIRSWATNRLMTGVKGATVNRDLAYLSAFFTWAIDQGVTTLNPALPKLVKRFPEPWRAYQSLSEAQISQVLALAPSHEERAKVALLLLTGQRWGVIAYLRWEQVDTNARLLTYRSKGKDRVIPLSDQALSILHSLSPSSGHVFKSRNRNTTIRWWYSARKTIGMPKLRLHDLRVTFARSMADKGYDLITVKECLGHSTLTMTQRYIPPSLSQMRAAMGAMGLMVRGDNGCGAIVNPRRPGGGAPDAEDMGDL
jgi:integrase